MTGLTMVVPTPGLRRRWGVPMLLAGLVIVLCTAYFGLRSPGEVIRHDLARAGSEVARLPASTPKELVQQALSRNFSDYRARIDATGFPGHVLVTLPDLDPAACRDAYQQALRIEGLVVIAIENPRREGTCNEPTTITWRITP